MATAVEHSAATAEALAEFAPLDDDVIARQTDAGSFSRGKTYFRGKRIFNAVRRGNLLRARCRGSSGGPYHVEATLAPAGKPKLRNPVTYACNCPRGGFCKHVVALLLTWIDDPDAFEVRPPLAEILAGKSQEELIALITVLVRQNPDLEELLELPVPLAGSPGDDPVDEAVIRRQIAAVLQDEDDYDRYDRYDRYGRYDYEEHWPSSGAAGALERLASLADAYAEAGDWGNTLRICAVFVEEIAPELASYLDPSGDLADLIVKADDHLAACLDAQDELPPEQRLSAAERTRLIDALFSIWQTSIDAGGLDLGEEGPEAIARGATPEEQRAIRDRLRASMHASPTDLGDRSWRKQAAIGFLSLLSGNAGLSDEELLEEYRNAELWSEAAEMLIQLDRVDEAVALASRRLTAANALTPFADRLIATGDPQRVKRAIALVDDQLWEQEGQNVRDDEVLRQWLERQYAAHGQPEKALELARGRFKAAPARSTYDAVKAAALLPNQPGDPWPALRPTLLAELGKLNGWYALIDIHLAEGEVAEALAALKKTERGSKSGQPAWGYEWSTPSGGYDARVAAAAEKDFPDESVRIYRRLADRTIAARGRANYQVAAEYLRRVMCLLERNDRAPEWSSLIAELRQENKSLRALKEELDSLGLR